LFCLYDMLVWLVKSMMSSHTQFAMGSFVADSF
jgi:hypothetical protein